MAQAKGIRWI